MRHTFPGHRPNPCLATGLVYIPYTKTDQNKFEILSSLQDGDDAYGRFDDVDSDGFTKVRNSKRQRVNTGGDDNDADTRFSQTPDLDTDADFDSLDMNENSRPCSSR